MTRLILQVHVSDECTYDYVQTFPLVHSSKQEAVAELEVVLMAKISAFFEFDRQRTAVHAKIDKLRGQLQDSPLLGRNDAIYAKILELYQSEPVFDSKFFFAGQTLYMDWFVKALNSQKQDFDLAMPQILTLDEYFQDVEHRLEGSTPVSN